MAHAFALALAVALLDVTLGYPAAWARAVGTPALWLQRWLATVRLAGAGWGGRLVLALYLLPVVVAAAVVAEILPSGPLGFVATALLASLMSSRQSLDRTARAVAATWESEGPYEAMNVVETLGGEESEPRLGRAAAAALAARFADEVVGPSLFVMIGGLPGVALFRALALAAREARERREATDFAAAVAALEGWTVAPALWLGGLVIALAGGVRPQATAPAAMLMALGDPPRDEPGYVRRALAIFRRAAALEMGALALLALAFAFG